MKAIASLFFYLSFLLFVAAQPQRSPMQVVQEATDEVLVLVKDPKLSEEQRRTQVRTKIRSIIAERFDFRSMSQSVLATGWQKATAYERDRFVDFFTQNLVNTYFEIINSYTDEKIRYVKEKISGDRAVVDTLIATSKGEIPVSYKMKLGEDGWHTYDIAIEHSSLINNYRTLYSGIIKTEGIDGLLERLQDKIELYKKNRAAAH